MEASQLLFSVEAADAQDVLIISSAALSLLNCVLAVGTYSYFHVAFALLEVVCTGLAFAIFLMVNFGDDDRTALEYSDNIQLYLLAFVVSILTEVANVVTTIRTVRIYNRLKRMAVTQLQISALKKQARRYCAFGIVYTTLSVGAIPIAAFWRADWETDFFSPVDFMGRIERLLFWTVVLNAAAQAFSYCIIIFTTEKQVQREPAVMLHPGLPCTLLLSIASLGVSLTALVEVNDPQQAGGMCYLFAIYAAQVIEFYCEGARHSIWMVFELSLYRAAHIASQMEDVGEVSPSNPSDASMV